MQNIIVTGRNGRNIDHKPPFRKIRNDLAVARIVRRCGVSISHAAVIAELSRFGGEAL